MSVERVFVGLGSNLADPATQVREAIDAIDASPQVTVVARSALYETAPWGITDQPAFVNAVIELRTIRSPVELMQSLLALEAEAGRRRGVRWGPRIIDLDILAWGSRQIDEPGLTVPHPRAAERDFVLVPWAEIAPEFALPAAGQVAELLVALAIPAESGPRPMEETCTEARTIPVP